RQKSAPVRSSLLTKQMRGTRYRSACRQTVSDWGSTPATPSKTTTAPSSTRRLRSTSTVKSTCPGVSMMLMRWSFQKQVVAAAVHRGHEPCGELLGHALAAALAGGLDQPSAAERKASIAPDLNRDLVGGAADPAGLDLDDRRRVSHRRFQDLEPGPVRLCLGTGQRLAQDPLREVPLSVGHQLGAEARGGAVGWRGLVLDLAGGL